MSVGILWFIAEVVVDVAFGSGSFIRRHEGLIPFVGRRFGPRHLERRATFIPADQLCAEKLLIAGDGGILCEEAAEGRDVLPQAA